MYGMLLGDTYARRVNVPWLDAGGRGGPGFGVGDDFTLAPNWMSSTGCNSIQGMLYIPVIPQQQLVLGMRTLTGQSSKRSAF